MTPFWLISLGSPNQTALDFLGNSTRIILAIERSRSVGSKFLCLPELCLTGYGCEDQFLSQAYLRQAEREVVKLLDYTQDFTLLVGAPIAVNHQVYNGMIMIQDQQILGIVPKKKLAAGGIYYESRHFTPWPVNSHTHIHYAGCDH
ncbi:MAG: NAD+ synthetase, partial [Proteobacteria bacterium]|nr:NAD+ synthetase [Pseudomonadota bacterium]